MNPRSTTSFLFTSLGKKYLMGLTGAYFVLFLVIHLIGNLNLLIGSDGAAFNLYAENMAHNPLIKVASPAGMLLILVHVIDGVLLTVSNKKARKTRYAVNAGNKNSSFAARKMAALGSIIFVFLVLHLKSFWFTYKFGQQQLNQVRIDGMLIPNRYEVVATAFSELWYVALYVAAMAVISLHVQHGFYSMFQSLGINHPKYTPLIKKAAVAYSILIPAGFALIPIVMFIQSR